MLTPTPFPKSFASDNHAGVHPAVLAAVVEANTGDAPAYGDDVWTRAAEDAVWFMLACSADGQLTVSFSHSEHFPFPLKPVSVVKLQSNNVPTALIEAKGVENNQIFIAPLLMRHVMPLLMQDNELVVSIPDQDGALHDYTFSMQPNDLALSPFRSRCFDL